MPSKEVVVPDIGTVVLIKRKGSRNIRLSLTPEGYVRVSLPTWVPYQAGLAFAKSKADWIIKQRQHTSVTLLTHGQALGKAHHLYFENSTTGKVSSRLKATSATVTCPASVPISHPSVQKVARQVAIRALRSEAEALLPRRLRLLAERGGFSYKSVQIKQLKRRWGSCNQNRDIVLNLFLLQLPWNLIDYVLWHELTHTKYLHHGEDFWTELNIHVPNAKALRRQIRDYNTDITVQNR